ncbi:DUF3784 domain-containing protein [Anaeromicropila herbilytica]|uniref:DUF3784 domain-containing protein n=1 Tax=Anaeromicropila herbilytica TaxID=2785025 RepID=A0A7R7ELQ6_9FIRM|nr:DUF3784 domain-containing protein [Anaeromicropila herbilytica]BCN31064.1 hypothetical protein bsdtb5_23590 [Anaeromicropila herbilytica]
MEQYILEMVITSVLGVFLFIVGILLLKKHMISLIHSYHYTNVKEEDKMIYTIKMGKAFIIMGIGIFLTGIIDCITTSLFGWLSFTISFIWGMILVVKAQKKFNGGMF